jgi:carboxyl-terminal processing protease
LREYWGWIAGAAILVLLAFGIGYGAYPLLHAGTPHGAPAAQAAAAGQEAWQESGGDQGLTPFWEAWGLLDQHFYGDSPTNEERYRGAISGMVASFDDPYTVVLPPVNNELDSDHMRGSFGGIGASIELSAGRFLLNPLADHPAAAAGVLRGDELLAVDGAPISAEMSTDAVVAALRGEVGSEVTLDLRRVITGTTAQPTGTATSALTATAPATTTQDFSVTLQRTEIRTPSVEAHLLPESSIGYMRQSSFTERSADELLTALNQLIDDGADRFIWDLRANPGGLLDAAIASTDLWLSRGAIVIESQADGSNNVVSARRGDAGESFPLVVLVDGGSASASEIAAGALQDHGRARIVGSRTFGKGSVQTLYELSDDSSLHVTTAQWLTPNRRQITGAGLAPDIAVESNADALEAARAAVLEQPQP